MPSRLINFTLHLADSALILGHRNSEWCGHGPILEQDIAITNISLDLIGQARNFYQYAAALTNSSQKTGSSQAPPSEVPKRSEGKERSSGEASEDSYAYFRNSREFKNILLVELPRGDWGQTILRQFFFSSWQNLLFEKLKESTDEQISAIATKALKEIAYHLRWSSEWVIRLGDGTDESRLRMEKAIAELWSYTEEMFIPVNYELEMMNIGIGTDVALLRESWMQNVEKVFSEAGLAIPSVAIVHTGGKEGKHTAYLDEILKELQSVARAHPTATW
jgi:ring-1,2-phenylacetyl-CoA epoxidase subunit PaaC